MKWILILFLIIGTVNANATPVPQKVLLAFSQLFPKASNIKWTESAVVFSVRFKTEKYIADFQFDREGRIIKSVRYYDESQLSPFLVARLNNMFPNFQIKNVTEITNEESVSYSITLSDNNSFYIVQSNGSFYITVENKLKSSVR